MLCIRLMNEQELISKLIEGDEAAFREVVRTLHVPMTYVARAIVGQDSAADVVQDAWVMAIKALPSFERRSSLKTWILSIVANAAKARLRKEGRMIAMGDAQDVENAGLSNHRFLGDGRWADPPRVWHADTPERILASEQLRTQIFKAIDELPENQRAVLVLRDIEEVEFSEICNILDISESNCRVLLHRARTRLWQIIDTLQSR